MNEHRSTDTTAGAESRPTPSVGKLLGDLGWWVLNGIQLAVTLVVTTAGIVLAVPAGWLAGSARIPLRMAAWWWSPFLLFGAGARLEVEGSEGVDFTKPALLVANHQSMIDICALFRAVPAPLRFVLKASLGRVPFLGWYTRSMGMVLLQRRQARDSGRQLEHATRLLREGHCIAAFPEGTRSRDGRVLAFKNSVFRAAIDAGVPVVPVAIEGGGRVMPPGGFRIRPGRIRLRFGRPLATTGLDRRDRRELARRARAAVIAMIDESSMNETA